MTVPAMPRKFLRIEETEIGAGGCELPDVRLESAKQAVCLFCDPAALREGAKKQQCVMEMQERLGVVELRPAQHRQQAFGLRGRAWTEVVFRVDQSSKL